jgi:hypothetical protein
MKPKFKLLTFLFFALVAGISACDILNLKKEEETDPEKTMGKVGNYWSATVPGVGSAIITIEENTGGNVVASIPYEGGTYEVEGKITDNGVYDYVYSNGDKSKPFTLVKFDANVGDKWEYKVGNQTVTIEVVKKSTEYDTPYIFWNIKTIDVLETIPSGFMYSGGDSKLKSATATKVNNGAAQIKSILWKFNHKYGFISAEITKLDDTKVTVSQSSTNADE